MRLYFTPGSRALAVHVLLRECGLPFELVEVPTQQGRCADPELRGRTGLGQVPALLLEDGQCITETLAIIDYLAERHSQLLPAAGAQRIRAQEWLSFLQTEVAPSLCVWMHVERYAGSEAGQQEVRAMVRGRLEELFDEIERRLDGSASVLERFGACDALLVVCFIWARHIELPMTHRPHLKAWARASFARPSVEQALRAEGLLTG